MTERSRGGVASSAGMAKAWASQRQTGSLIASGSSWPDMPQPFQRVWTCSMAAE
jgi:hypothetical protein